MKINSFINSTMIVALALSTFFTSCKDKDDDDNTVNNNGQNEKKAEGINIQNERLLYALVNSTDVDRNGDGVITRDEAEETTTLDLSGQNLGDLNGLDYFKNLEKLDCSNNNLNTLDVSSLFFLQELNCDGNNLVSLDLSENDRLKSLSCTKNKLDTLNLMTNDRLSTIVCGNQQTGNNLKLVIDNKQYTTWESNLSNEKNGSVDIVMNLFEDGNLRYYINNESIEIGEVAMIDLPISTSNMVIKKNGSNLTFKEKSVWEQLKWESSNDEIVTIHTATTSTHTLQITLEFHNTVGRAKITGTDGLGNTIFFQISVI